LVVGDKPGEKKQESALKLGIQQIDESQFLKLLERGFLNL
jgi:BRCT domain type II-containing protein